MILPNHEELYVRYLWGDPEATSIVESMARHEREARSSEMTKELTTMDQDRTKAVLDEVLAERAKQHKQWGDQRLPFHHPVDRDGQWMFGASYTAMAYMCKRACDARRDLAQRTGEDNRSNVLVLLEEVFEALAETDPARIREELIQVAAVACKAVEVIDREQR